MGTEIFMTGLLFTFLSIAIRVIYGSEEVNENTKLIVMSVFVLSVIAMIVGVLIGIWR